MIQYSKLICVLLFLFLFVSVFAQKRVKKYLHKYESLAIAKAEQHRIPASIILGVSMIESSCGESSICKSLNNFFGIKGKNWSSKDKMGYKSAYKEYATEVESFEHFCQVVKKKNFYRRLKGSVDFKEWLENMNNASYASAKRKWIDQISRTITQYKLYKLDKEIQNSTAANP